MIKPSEISDILKQQLDEVDSKINFEEVGTVLEVGDGVAHVYGLENVRSSELIEFENGVHGVAMNLEESNVGVILFDNVDKVTENMTARRTGEIASLPVGEGLLGRVINTLGEPIDGAGPIQGELIRLPLERKAPGVIVRQPVDEPLQTGIKAIDSMVPIGRGQRELIIGDRQIGKTAIAIDTIINQRDNYKNGTPLLFGSCIGKYAESTRRPRLHRSVGSQCFRFGRHALLRAVCRSRHWRILPGQRSPRFGNLRRLVETGCLLS